MYIYILHVSITYTYLAQHESRCVFSYIFRIFTYTHQYIYHVYFTCKNLAQHESTYICIHIKHMYYIYIYIWLIYILFYTLHMRYNSFTHSQLEEQRTYVRVYVRTSGTCLNDSCTHSQQEEQRTYARTYECTQYGWDAIL